MFPEPAAFLPGSGEPTLRWGIIAPGGIAAAFAQSVQQHSNQTIAGVASRSRSRADEFAAKFGIDRVYASYEELVDSPEIDVVYVAAPVAMHVELGLLAIAAGKHVLVEKPLAPSAADARRLVAAARQQGILLMEGMWSRYLPQASVIRMLVDDGVLGEPRGVLAESCQAIPYDSEHRLYRPELGGGALLDLGIYPIQLDSMILGAPTSVRAIGGLTQSGVDAYSTVVLGHGADAQSTLISSIIARTDSSASIRGSEARIEMAGPHHTPTSLTLRDNEVHGPRLTWTDSSGLTFYQALSWEATALATFVGEGRTESPLHSLDETVQILETLDEARSQLHFASGSTR
ncbi:Gfo/Idh/MocA family protein [Subtercola frigoramans]|uniref:Dehydrogenase n=1 Tax=Subtercola frigoramans TaxID=120298 RepID=A0ABS2L7P8_9MICO|nr:Gfo/Idh/MocA family oxidoreductase [Subtercola frigoramans]MBM7473107.1 putative dehydrogenase [Subtercola frigoramans]